VEPSRAAAGKAGQPLVWGSTSTSGALAGGWPAGSDNRSRPLPIVCKRSSGGKAPVPAKHRRANLGAGFAQVPVYLGQDLAPGMEVAAPAIIEESFTTIVVYPGWKARIDDAGDYELVRA